MFSCEVIYPRCIINNNISYNDILSEDVLRQAAVAQLYATIIERREDASASTTGPSFCLGSTGQLQLLIIYHI